MLEARQRLLGDEHPDTIIAAWNLFRVLLDSGDAGAAKDVFEQSLRWLLERDPITLAGVHRQIQQRLRAMQGSVPQD